MKIIDALIIENPECGECDWSVINCTGCQRAMHDGDKVKCVTYDFNAHGHYCEDCKPREDD